MVSTLGFEVVDGKPINSVRVNVNTVYALSLPQAVQAISSHRVDHVIAQISLANRFIGVQHVLAYPCRFARWIWNNREARSRELKAVQTMLRIQTRQAVLRKIDDSHAVLDVAIPADAPPPPPLPYHCAKHTIGRWDSISVNEHGESLQTPDSVGKPSPAPLDSIAEMEYFSLRRSVNDHHRTTTQDPIFFLPTPEQVPHDIKTLFEWVSRIQREVDEMQSSRDGCGKHAFIDRFLTAKAWSPSKPADSGNTGGAQ
ncbi:hypothetical protein JIN84_18040 [Luteolibacter yonseiensis]|uniref:Uncharacterized protein n=2 Tax=Luteolibacter yonseiensis TaxID=1144680 RepID=A0A934R5U2_9BACT|nr:hypothetical protein [Luteolibacter yonseiensis]MBK1817527.1 hypothetical protein [Luteolibacter yonseiensis]